jgi:hypothetical protein
MADFTVPHEAFWETDGERGGIEFGVSLCSLGVGVGKG